MDAEERERLILDLQYGYKLDRDVASRLVNDGKVR